jgi:succinate dehydrogenase subunit D (EC 1.3.5.1)
MSLRSDLGRARGLGAAHDGVQHWWRQRVSAVALVPLALWFAFSVARYPLRDYAAFSAWLHNPYVAIALILFVALVFYHSALGLQVVIEDYVTRRRCVWC